MWVVSYWLTDFLEQETERPSPSGSSAAATPRSATRPGWLADLPRKATLRAF